MHWALTPIDHPLPAATAYRTPTDKQPVNAPEVVRALREVALEVAAAMETPHASIDCAMINGRPGVVEMNPMRLGHLGLYAADVRALARASRVLLANPAMEEEFDGYTLAVNGDPSGILAELDRDFLEPMPKG